MVIQFAVSLYKGGLVERFPLAATSSSSGSPNHIFPFLKTLYILYTWSPDRESAKVSLLVFVGIVIYRPLCDSVHWRSFIPFQTPRWEPSAHAESRPGRAPRPAESPSARAESRPGRARPATQRTAAAAPGRQAAGRRRALGPAQSAALVGTSTMAAMFSWLPLAVLPPPPPPPLRLPPPPGPAAAGGGACCSMIFGTWVMCS